MTDEARKAVLCVPQGPVDCVLDTDTYNEIDDQFALSYMLLSGEKLHTKAIFAAPFFNSNSVSPEDGMEKSYDEIQKLLSLLHREDVPSYRGSRRYLADEKTPVPSEACDALLRLSQNYTAEKPLYVVAIGCITNIASALLQDPTLADRIVLVWLAGRAHHFGNSTEFNLSQDIAAARVVFSSGAPIVQVPCAGVADHFLTSKPELEAWLVGVNPLADYLAQNTIAAAEEYAHGRPWSRVIWDVTAVAYLLNDHNRFMSWKYTPTYLPDYDNNYVLAADLPQMAVAEEIWRDSLFNDLFTKLRNFQ